MIVSGVSPNRFVLSTDWDGYLRFLDAVSGRRVKVTYDGINVELTTPSRRHESLKALLAQMLGCLMVEWNIDAALGGSTTFKKKLKNRGLEPDECYWFSNWRQVEKSLDDADLPPPDLAIEVEVTRSVLDRFAIYAELDVPEVWRVSTDGEVSVWLLHDGEYQNQANSHCLPSLPIELLSTHLARAGEMSSTALIRNFRDALRELAPDGSEPEP